MNPDNQHNIFLIYVYYYEQVSIFKYFNLKITPLY